MVIVRGNEFGRQLRLACGLALSAYALAGCSTYQESNRIAALSPPELAALNDQDICTGRRFNPRNEALLAAAAQRGLGDCSASHIRCVERGALYGTPAYVQCRRRNAGTGVVLSITGQNFVPVRTDR